MYICGSYRKIKTGVLLFWNTLNSCLTYCAVVKFILLDSCAVLD